MALVTVQRSPSSNNSPSNIEGNIEYQNDMVDSNRNRKSLSECYFAGKGAALVLPAATENQKTTIRVEAQENSNIQKHLQSMFYLLRPDETLKMAVKLESVHFARTRYLVVVSKMGLRGEESCLLGIDCNEKTTVGLVLRVMADTKIRLDGDGGFSVSSGGRHHIFKPVSVQAMWSALQTLHKVSSKAREQNHFQGGLSHGWVNYFENKIQSDRSCLNEWHAMDNLESKRPPSPDSIRTKPTKREETEKVIRSTLKEIMMSVDLDEVTSKYIRSRLEEDLDMDLGEYKSFIDQEMLTILGQMDAPTEIFDHVYLGSEWNASNYEELQRNGVGHILNVTREIDNFFPGTFDYLNVRVYDDEKTDLLKHWDDTFKYITKAKKCGSKVLVHCKMGISRSASVVIAYAMKAFNWDFKTAMDHVKEKRTCIKPNTNFLSQLETYQGILDAMKNKEKLQRSKSETNLKSPKKNKIEKVLIGSEPTPIVQAIFKKDLTTNLSGQDLRYLGVRPKSWSPDNNTVISDKSPVFLSLEDLSQKCKENITNYNNNINCGGRHVLMPFENGESYSVTPNQIVHLPGQCCIKDNESTNININNNNLRNLSVKNEVWDPGDQTWTSTTILKTNNDLNCDYFLNDIDKLKDKKQQQQQEFPLFPVEFVNGESSLNRDCMSRQSSWSSYDSELVLSSSNQNSNTISRHSSWGSGDIKRLPSRNSSWGSYDNRQRNDKIDKLSTTLLQDPLLLDTCLLKNEISQHIGTVKKTKNKLENNSAIIIDIPCSDEKNKDQSRLSVSAPESSSLKLISHNSLSKSANNIDTKSTTQSTTSYSLVKQHKTFLESLRKEGRNITSKINEICNSGIVKNLKKEFEAKTISPDQLNTDLSNDYLKIKKNQSNPTSPTYNYNDKSETKDDFRNLVGLFENNKEDNDNKLKYQIGKNSRYSCIEVSLEKSPTRITQSSLLSSLSTNQNNNNPNNCNNNNNNNNNINNSINNNRNNNNININNHHHHHHYHLQQQQQHLNHNHHHNHQKDNKRPPISPTVRNASPGLMVAATVIAKAAKKQQQQFGKSHPLAMLPRHNNPVYNTM